MDRKLLVYDSTFCPIFSPCVSTMDHSTFTHARSWLIACYISLRNQSLTYVNKLKLLCDPFVFLSVSRRLLKFFFNFYCQSSVTQPHCRGVLNQLLFYVVHNSKQSQSLYFCCFQPTDLNPNLPNKYSRFMRQRPGYRITVATEEALLGLEIFYLTSRNGKATLGTDHSDACR